MDSDISVLLAALILDFLISEPPIYIHPVFWLGKAIYFFDRLIRFSNPYIEIVYGAFSTAVVVIFAVFISILHFPHPLSIIWQCYLLFSAISIRSMITHAEKCIKDGIDRVAVQNIVSRDTSELNDEQLCSAVIESIAENYVDGVVSPLFYFSIFGITGTMIYKAINVCDAMIGYRKDRYEYFGKVAARLDDALNYIPARLSLIFFEMIRRGALEYGIKNNVKLNGCTISAMSYVLGAKLEKPGYYSLPGKKADINTVKEAINVFKVLSLFAVIVFTAITAIRILLLTPIVS